MFGHTGTCYVQMSTVTDVETIDLLDHSAIMNCCILARVNHNNIMFEHCGSWRPRMAKMRPRKDEAQDGQDEAQDGQNEAQDGQDEAQDGQDVAQDGQDEAQDGQDEAQDGQDEAQHAPKMGPGRVPNRLGPHQEHDILRNWSSWPSANFTGFCGFPAILGLFDPCEN